MIENKKNKLLPGKITLITGLLLLLLLEGFAGYRVYTLSHKREGIRADYCTVNSIVFGLFSISEWRDKITVVLKNKIDHFDLSPDQLGNLETEVKEILNALIDKAVNIINQKQETISGKIKKAAFNTFIDKDKLHEQVPAFSHEIIKKVNSPASKRRLSKVVQSKVSEFEKETYDSAQYVKRTVRDTIFQKYNSSDYNNFEKQSGASLINIKADHYMYTSIMLGSILLFLSFWWFLRNKKEFYPILFTMSLFSAFILLLVGLSTTMIEVDARIEKLQMIILGKELKFENQVLFFQSKSIMAVVKVLLTTGKFDSVFVGILLLCFSILFPVLKLSCLGIYQLGKSNWTKSGIVSFFAFKSGKWSMADVMVIGILMTYIGFNGILESQLAYLHIENDSLTSITTNNTSLQPGYIIFVGFVLYGLLLSEILKKTTAHQHIPQITGQQMDNKTFS